MRAFTSREKPSSVSTAPSISVQFVLSVLCWSLSVADMPPSPSTDFALHSFVTAGTKSSVALLVTVLPFVISPLSAGIVSLFSTLAAYSPAVSPCICSVRT